MANVQTFLVLLAAILFSTIILSVNNNLIYQSRMISYQMIRLQALKISELYFDKIGAESKGTSYAFDDLDNFYDDTDTTFVLNGIDYRTTINTNYCDSVGDSLNPTTDFQRVDVRVSVNYNGQQLRIGTLAAPLSKVFLKIDF
ncbi:MAG: hypothetical protein U9N34_00640 [Candidatus Cloacimonadota bacterium]|nr:hypothetical protein [Candidatus Cloacimonadota bacterium]